MCFSPPTNLFKEVRFGYIFDADFLISDMSATVRTDFAKAITQIMDKVVNSTSIDLEPPTSEALIHFLEKNADYIEILRKTTMINKSDNEIIMTIALQSFRGYLLRELFKNSNERIIRKVRSEIERRISINGGSF